MAGPGIVPLRNSALDEQPDPPASAKIPVRLPPLNLFRTFDAAVRHRSFRLAAEELCVTPSAVSQQIRQLEEFLDVRLFRRLTRRVELTHDGMVLAPAVQDALSMLQGACERIRDPAALTVVCVNAAPVLALRWLIGRLKLLMEQNAHIKISLLTSTDPLDFERQDVDLGIRWGDGNFPDMRAELLGDDAVFPVCSPEVATAAARSGDLRGLTLLQAQQGMSWSYWCEMAGFGKGAPSADVVYFSDAALMLEAAAHGQGVALTNALLVEGDLSSGRLVRLLDRDVNRGGGFFVLSSHTLGDRPAVTDVREWLQREARLTVEIVKRRVLTARASHRSSF